jgi:hypothetical protein
VTYLELAGMISGARQRGKHAITMCSPPPKSGVTGYRMRTVFGLCYVLNVTANSVVFQVSLDQAEKFLAKCQAELEAELARRAPK